MLIFKTLRYKNFLSTGDQFTEIKLNENSATLVFGTNGAGKSTMLDALTYGLFGKAYRNVNKPTLINSINARDMLVEVEFTVGKINYMIRRGMKPNIFEVYVKGKMLDQDSKLKDYQSQLEQNILKLNYRSFCQVVVLGSSTFVPFMRLPAAERRFIIEDLLDIRIFSSMNVLLKQRLSDLKDMLQDTDLKLEISSEKVNIQEKYLSDIKSDNKKKIAEIKKQIKENQTNRVELVAKIKNLQDEITSGLSSNRDIDATKKKQAQLEILHEKIEGNIGNVNNDIEFYSQNDNCPTCKQNIDSDFKSHMIHTKQSRIDELEKGLSDLDTELKETSNRLEIIRASMKEIKALEKELSSKNGDIQAIDQYIGKLQIEMNDLLNKKENSESEESRITELRVEVESLKSRRDTLVEDKHHMEIVAMMLKDSGIKTKIISQYLPIINKHVNKYLSDLDFFVNFQLDESFREIIKSRGRDEFSYENFSEGEKLRIDLALLFTWRDIARIKNSASTNILIMDEILDRSLDSIGIEEFLKMMSELWHGMNIFVISPRGEIFMDKFPATIQFRKHKNFSVIAND